MIDRSYKLDMIPMDNLVTIHVSQYDTDYQILLLLFSSNGTLTFENGTSVEMRGTKPDKTSYTKSMYITDQSVLMQGDINLTDVAGNGIYELCFTHGSKVLHTSNFIVKAEQCPQRRG
jgi:hypothetical protein